METAKVVTSDMLVQQTLATTSNQSDGSTKNTIKSKIKNPLGGKNPQLSVKGKKVTKNIKNVSRKEKGIIIGGNPKVNANVSKGTTGKVEGKENIPSSNTSADKNKVQLEEEQVVLSYMKTMYKSRGENLLNKFKRMEPLRLALGHINNINNSNEETDKSVMSTSFSSRSINAQLTSALASGTDTQSVNGVISPKNALASGTDTQIANGVISPMTTVEEVAPPTSNLSL